MAKSTQTLSDDENGEDPKKAAEIPKKTQKRKSDETIKEFPCQQCGKM